MIRNADRFAEWRDLLFPSLWWKPKHLRMLAPWACHQFSCAHLRGSTGLQAGELPSLLAGCGKTRLRACFGKGTSLLVPICPLLLSFRGGFSRRGICFSEFFRNLLGVSS